MLHLNPESGCALPIAPDADRHFSNRPFRSAQHSAFSEHSNGEQNLPLVRPALVPSLRFASAASVLVLPSMSHRSRLARLTDKIAH